MKYNYFKWYKIPKRGLRNDSSGTAVLLRNRCVWYLSNTATVASHSHQIGATHFMIFPGFCNNWMGPAKLQDILNTL